MLKTVLPAAEKVEAFRPLLNMLSDVFITSDELCSHWRLTPTHLCNLRKRNKGAPFVKLPSGKILYRVSDIIGAELRGRAGPLTVDVVCLVLAACEELTLHQREIAQRAVRRALEIGK
ncbi:hypothetical protein [Hyphomicrobium sp. MC1]|uniref:hypothetical protein n=1 Tax=Hyphomicrobium sp. (strain MC1) TaxID=717785 RepID=UPI000213D3F4|nr:hypothetical protein [Hyphomicrobium sp. MC1]CCB67446.1 protein of unknown function [Hyphomicrobium sp. MC1]